MTTRPRGRPPHPDLLAPAEWAVLNLVRHGLTQRESADRRGISRDAAAELGPVLHRRRHPRHAGDHE